MVILEFFAILTAVIVEAVNLQTGSIKTMTNWMTRPRQKGKRTRLLLSFLLWVGSLLYLGFAISWCFSPTLPVQVAGLTLMVLTGVSVFVFRAVGLARPVWMVQVDATLSLACVLTVALVRIRGF